MIRHSRMLKLLSLTCLGAVLLVHSSAAAGSSFHCAKATEFVEKLTCSDRVAGKEPEQMPAQGAVSLATIAGTEWVLQEWGKDESVPAKPEVTLLFTEGRFTGHSGCNRYFASVKEE